MNKMPSDIVMEFVLEHKDNPDISSEAFGAAAALVFYYISADIQIQILPSEDGRI